MKIVTLEWHEWWFYDIVLQFPAYYNSISITEPRSIFMDKNKDLETWNEGIKSQKLSSIADVCNRFILPNVICPCIFFEFIYKFRYVDLDIVIQLFIQKIKISFVGVSKLTKLNTRSMTTPNNLTIAMICGFTIRIGKYLPQLIFCMDTLAY